MKRIGQKNVIRVGHSFSDPLPTISSHSYLSERPLIFVLAFVSIIVIISMIVIPLLIRENDFEGYPLGKDVYLTARQSSLDGYDPLAFSGSQILFDPMHIVIASWAHVFPVVTLSALLMLINSLLILLILYRMQMSVPTIFLALLLLSLSPVYLSSHLDLDGVSVALFLTLLYILSQLFLHSRYIGLVLPFLVPFFGFSATLFITTAIIALSGRWHDNRRLQILAGILCALGFIGGAYMHVASGMTLSSYILPRSDIFFMEFGSLEGQSLPQMGLFMIGFFLSWSKERKRLQIGCLALIFLASLYAPLMLFAGVIIAIYGALCLQKMLYTTWSASALKYVAFIILISGLVLSQFLFVMRLSSSEPTLSRIHACLALRDIPPRAVVLSDAGNGFLIESIANRPTVVDQQPTHPLFEDRVIAMNEMFFAGKIDQLYPLLIAYNVTYIYIDSTMRTKIWSRPSEGLLQILMNERLFPVKYDVAGHTIYYVDTQAINASLSPMQ